jgi:1,4-alpha-glucan branching enzyme
VVVQRSNGEFEFHFFRPQAQDVHLLGDFNDWDREALPMTREDNGDWVCRLRLPRGTYQFKYLADGEWYADYAAFGLEWTPSGLNSVVET